jgi:hypothetical protein
VAGHFRALLIVTELTYFLRDSSIGCCLDRDRSRSIGVAIWPEK